MVCLLMIFCFHSETVINVILTKFVCCADSDLLYISKLSLFYLASHSPEVTNMRPAKDIRAAREAFRRDQQS